MTSLGDLPLAHPLASQLDNVKTAGKVMTIPLWTIIAGVPQAVANYDVVINPDGMVFHLIKANQQPRPQAALSFEKLGQLAMVLDMFARAPATYATIKGDAAFGALYPSGPHAILYANGARAEESMSCQICGIVLPGRYMQMDHQRPQVGGQLESAVKSMRVLGLTAGAPSGGKCTQLAPLARAMAGQKDATNTSAAFMAAKWDQLKPVTPRLLRTAVVGGGKPELRARYTLNEQGELLFSLVKAFKLDDLLVRQSMHTLANLRPLCGPCNGARGNGDLKVTKM